MGTVNVTFMGICTHFRDTVPGIPHRVVLADASAFRFGIAVLVPNLHPDLGAASTPNQATYFLMPHFAIVRTPSADVQQALNITGVMENGNIFSGVHLTIPNAVGAGVSYEPSYQTVPLLTTYMEDYAYSPEVVLGGQAGIYFDLYSATIGAFPGVDLAVDVTATIETDGPPELLATPFFRGAPHRISLVAGGQDPDAPVELVVANQGMDCETQENSYDFLLHYLTNRTGIPRRLIAQPPGIDPTLTPFTQPILNDAANVLKTFDFPANFNSPCLQLEGLFMLRRSYRKGEGFWVQRTTGEVLIVSVACSNSGYP